MENEKKYIKNPTFKTRYSFLKILTGSDLSRRRLPFMLLESRNPGPIVWLTACAHGDEIGGMVTIQEVFKTIRKENLLLKGSLYAFPLMNPMGLEISSRSVALNEEDLNRSFPGSKNGSLAERLADKIFSTIIRTSPSLVLDLHNDWLKSIPYTLLDPKPPLLFEQDIYEKVKTFSHKTGLLVVEDSSEFKKTLSYNLIQRSVPALTLELGASYIVNEKDIEYGVKSVWNILSYLKMIKSEKTFNYPIPETCRNKILAYSDSPSASTSGVIRYLAEPAAFVKKGQPVAKIYNAFGKRQETIIALKDSIILGHSDSPVAFPGMPIIAFGNV